VRDLVPSQRCCWSLLTFHFVSIGECLPIGEDFCSDCMYSYIRGGADKSLAQPGGETSYSDQTRDLFNILPTKLSTLLSLLLFCKPLKKKFRRLSLQPGLLGG
jgi:hypothetical protein